MSAILRNECRFKKWVQVWEMSAKRHVKCECIFLKFLKEWKCNWGILRNECIIWWTECIQKVSAIREMSVKENLVEFLHFIKSASLRIECKFLWVDSRSECRKDWWVLENWVQFLESIKKFEFYQVSASFISFLLGRFDWVQIEGQNVSAQWVYWDTFRACFTLIFICN